MSNASTKPKSRSVRRQRSICQVHYNLPRRGPELMARPLGLPGDLHVQAFDLQVAGHRKTEDTKFLGLLQCSNDTILKPIIKPSQRREVDFYTRLASTKHPDLIELRGFVPKFYGTTKFSYNGFEQEYIILEDLTQGMLEQCVMDVKIGKRTWDPLASEEKMRREQSKYAQCKQQYGFCIPGYQVHARGRLLKFGKEHGKKLRGQGVVDAIRTYLNGFGTTICRALILQLLSELWKIQKWSRRQTSLRVYSASLLLVYDAAKLRSCCGDDVLMSRSKCRPQQLPARRRSIHSLHSLSSSSFSGQLSSSGPVYRKLNSVPLTCMTTARNTFSPLPTVKSPWTEALDKLHQNHSFENNYEDKLSKIKMNYRSLLDQLCSDTPNPHPWCTVKIIDFAHAFFNDETEMSVDENFREGIDNFVEIFERFLKETDDQFA